MAINKEKKNALKALGTVVNEGVTKEIETPKGANKKVKNAQKLDLEAGQDIKVFRRAFFWLAFTLTIIFSSVAIICPVLSVIYIKSSGTQLAGIISGVTMPIIAIIGLWKVTAKEIFSKMFHHRKNVT